jgi:triosephosphate isomerase
MLIVANWKMNPETIEEAKEIAGRVKRNLKNFGTNKIVLCPPFTFLSEVSKAISGSKISLGAQDLFAGTGLSHTGEISGEMLKSVGTKYIIVGHSEMRENGDTDEIVEKKLLAAIGEGFKAILCVGEKERNDSEQFEFIKSQLYSALKNFPKKSLKNLIIGYEPIWAIGKSEKEAMKGEEVYEMNIFIKRVVSDILKTKEIDKLLVLYGGSVTVGNAKDIAEKGKIDGLLIGRESLKVENFLELIKELK